MFKRILSMVLVVCMAMLSVPTGVFAAGLRWYEKSKRY